MLSGWQEDNNNISATEIEVLQENQENNQVAIYQHHVMQVEKVRREIAENDKTYKKKLVIHGSIHRRKLAFAPGDKVLVAPDHDINQKT